MANDSVFAKINNYFKEIRSESKKVEWPNAKQLRNNTVVVIAMILIFGVFIWGTDALMGWLNTVILGS